MNTPDPLDVARIVDAAAAALHAKHADDLTFVPEWGPLERVLPAAELGGWMFMNRNAGPRGEIISYKHGITRKGLHLDRDGVPWMPIWGDGTQPVRWSPLPIVTAVELLTERGHYRDLTAMDARPGTRYDDDYKAERNRRLGEAGFTVIEGQA